MTLNRLREAQGLNVFTFRPHCGEAGDSHHLSTAFLLAHGINHGIRLARAPALAYLYYLAQVRVGGSLVQG
jgi:AMP deaminase